MTRGIKKISLPYSFIPFPDDYYYPYDENSLPKHDKLQDLNGYIEYEIEPVSDLIMDFRESEKGRRYYVSGSSMKGKIRNNVEILSASYPVFIDRVNLSYRDITGSKSIYKSRLLGDATDDDIEKIVQVGYLKKKDDKYYIRPAKCIGNRYFTSMEEFRVVKKINLNEINRMYEYKNGIEKILDKYKSEIEELSNQIKKWKEDNQLIWEQCREDVDKVFKRKCNFNTLYGKAQKELSEDLLKQEVEKNLKQLKSELIKAMDTKDTKDTKDKLIKLYLDRMRLKTKIYLEHLNKKNIDKNSKFIPYDDKNIFFSINSNGGVSDIFEKAKENQGLEKGVLYCSTNASTKKRHYIIGEENAEAEEMFVSENLINAYNQNMRSFKIVDKNSDETKIKKFYNIFDEEFFNEDGMAAIVFYIRNNQGVVESIGRTPYMKVPYKNQIEDLLAPKYKKTNLSIDYARALFGFTQDDLKYDHDVEKLKECKEKTSYKSRLRFSPLVFETEAEPEEISWFTLLDPKPSACGMYLKQNKTEKITYENEEKDIALNGYKYYKLLGNPIELESTKNDNVPEYKSARFAMKKEKIISISGKIYFKNLNEFELGLLLLALDANQLKTGQKVKLNIKDKNNQYLESIGGAKPYGYGVVKIKIRKIRSNSYKDKEIRIEDLINYKSDSADKYVESFINKFESEKLIKNIKFSTYWKSKIIQTSKVEYRNWENLPSNGYSKDWILAIDDN